VVPGKEPVNEQSYYGKALIEEIADLITPVGQQDSNDTYFDIVTTMVHRNCNSL